MVKFPIIIHWFSTTMYQNIRSTKHSSSFLLRWTQCQVQRTTNWDISSKHTKLHNTIPVLPFTLETLRALNWLRLLIPSSICFHQLQLCLSINPSFHYTIQLLQQTTSQLFYSFHATYWLDNICTDTIQNEWNETSFCNHSLTCLADASFVLILNWQD